MLFLSFLFIVSCNIFHDIFKNLFICSNKITIKPITWCFFTGSCYMDSVSCQLALIELSFIFASIIKKQMSFSMSSKVFQISIINLTFWISNSSFSNDFALNPISLYNLLFRKSQLSFTMKFIQEELSFIDETIWKM